MSKTLIGIVTFGGLDFTKITINSIKETSKTHVDFLVVVGKPGDEETKNWCVDNNINYIVHLENKGFPASINDIYDYAWNRENPEDNYDYLILAGNDIAVYPYAIDQMIHLADISDYECINGLQVDVRSLVSQHPDIAYLFYGPDMIFKRFNTKPWEVFRDYSAVLSIDHMKLLDIQNLCLYKKSIMNKVGYTDVAFYPAYFVDNDYARRMVNANIKSCCLASSRFFHFWSRTIKQGEGGSTNKYFDNNAQYYFEKWGGAFGSETVNAPVLINTRDNEEETIRYWREKGK
jgi:GT2 family glycosyltransferase